MFQAGALIELSGDVDTAFDIYYETYDIHELPEHIFDEMMHFFEVYKSLEHDKKTTVKEICHRDEAMDIINKCVKKYKEIFDK